MHRKGIAVYWFGFITVVVMFAISIVLRSPYLFEPLADSMDWITAQSLIALENAHAYPLSTHYYRIIQTYPTDTFVPDSIIRIFDKHGIGYYTTFPPLSIIFTDIVFRLLGVVPNEVSLRVLSLFLHGITTLLLYGIFIHLTGKNIWRSISVSVVGCGLYIFLPMNLWSYFHLYSWDIFWLYTWILFIWIMVVKIGVHVFPAPPLSRIVWAFIGSFLLAYSEHQGALAVMGMIALLIWQWFHTSENHKKTYRNLVLSLSGGIASAFALTLVQYSTIDGLGSFISLSQSKFMEYSAASFQDIGFIFKHYVVTGYPVIVLLLFLAVIAIRLRAFRFKPGNGGLVMAMAFPVVVHHTLFIHWSAVHFFSALKGYIVIIFLIVLLMYSILIQAKRVLTYALVMTAFFLMAFCIILFVRYYIEPRGDVWRYRRLGEKIARLSADRDVIYSNTSIMYPQVVYYAKRNIALMTSRENIVSWLSAHNKRQALILDLNLETMELKDYSYVVMNHGP